MKKIKYIDQSNFHDLTMLVLQKTQFSSGDTDLLADEISNKYVAVYNSLVEKFDPIKKESDIGRAKVR